MTKPKKERLLGFNVDEDLQKRVKARSASFASGAEYLRSVVLADLDADARKPHSYDAQVLVNLAKIYGGYFAPQLETDLTLQQANQPALLHTLLHSMGEAINSGHRWETLLCAPVRHTSHDALPDAAREVVTSSADSAVTKDANVVASAAHQDEHLAAMLHQLAEYVRRRHYVNSETSEVLVAETPSTEPSELSHLLEQDLRDELSRRDAARDANRAPGK